MDRIECQNDDHAGVASADHEVSRVDPGLRPPPVNVPPVNSRPLPAPAPVRPKRNKPTFKRGTIAALDLGTNNCRLLVARATREGFEVIDAFSRIVRLGEGVARNGLLSDLAMNRTMAALAVCSSKLRRRSVEAGFSRAVATEACRRAANFPEFRRRVLDRFGIDLEVISSGEEARLAVGGCAPLLDPGIPYALVFDIGGGSTEIMWLKVGPAEDGAGPAIPRFGLVDGVSLPVGVVNLSERHGGLRVAPDAYDAMIKEVSVPLSRFGERHDIRRHIMAGNVQVLGSSGTVTTLAGVAMGLPRYDRSQVDGSYLDATAARSISRELLGMSFSERCGMPCIGRDRGDLVVSGCAILEAILDLWPVERVRIADRGVREGILFDLARSVV